MIHIESSAEESCLQKADGIIIVWLEQFYKVEFEAIIETHNTTLLNLEIYFPLPEETTQGWMVH